MGNALSRPSLFALLLATGLRRAESRRRTANLSCTPSEYFSFAGEEEGSGENCRRVCFFWLLSDREGIVRSYTM